jgi:catechol 2,3-dioxygenase
MNAGSMFRPRRFAHSNIFIADVHRSMDFYRSVAGLEECFQEPAMHAGFMGNGNTHHDIGLTQVSDEDIIGRDNQVLVPAGFGKKPGLFHLAFEVENEAELVAGFDRAIKSGVRIVMTVDHTIAKSVYILDPEGNVLELTADSTKDWRKTFQDYAGQLVTGPWSPGKYTPSTDRYYPANDPDLASVSDELMHSRRATHAVLGCRDFLGQLTFYKDVVGLQDAFSSTSAGIAVLKGTAAAYSMVLFESVDGSKHGLHHTAYEVSDSDMDGAEARLQAAQVPVTQSYMDAGKRSLFVRDPDGLGVEFFSIKGTSVEPPPGEAAKKFWMVTA